MNFHVGQKVVCVDDALLPGTDPQMCMGGYYVPNGIKRGALYTLRSVEISARDGNLYVRLHEVVNPIRLYGSGPSEVRFGARRFRPVTEKKTDIAIFTSILDRENGKRERVDH